MHDNDIFFANVADPNRFREAIRRFDELNSRDPNQEQDGGAMAPREFLQSVRLCNWIMTLAPGASEELRLAARSQHLCRWEIPRATYPQTRAGYHQWKTELKRFHAQRSGEVLRVVQYPEEVVQRVSALNLKKGFPADAETRVLEDALCLVFLQYQLGELAAKLDDEKTINALRKSWEKMTESARNHALKLNFTDRERTLVEKALAPS